MFGENSLSAIWNEEEETKLDIELENLSELLEEV